MQGALANPESPTASDWLRTETRTAHQRAEAAVMRRLDTRSQQSYVAYLERAFGFYSPLEPLLEAQPGHVERISDFAERRKAPWLRADLNFYGCEVERVPLCARLPEPKSSREALGIAYVFEGATLGGGVLLRMLSIEPRPAAGHGATFLSGYGPETARLWRSFKQALDQSVERPEHLAELLRGATHAFSAFERWFAEP